MRRYNAHVLAWLEFRITAIEDLLAARMLRSAELLEPTRATLQQLEIEFQWERLAGQLTYAFTKVRP